MFVIERVRCELCKVCFVHCSVVIFVCVSEMHFSEFSRLVSIVLLVLAVRVSRCQIINRPPQFVPGSGDMSRFSLSESTPVGSPIYQLRGEYDGNRIKLKKSV